MDFKVASDCLNQAHASIGPDCEERKPKKRDGLTLVEVLVSLSIIGLLIAIALPAVLSARTAHDRMKCSHQQRQLLLAISTYHDAYNAFPPISSISTGLGTLPATVISRLFPYLGLGDFDVVANSTVTRIPLFECPSDAELAQVPTPFSYVFNASAGTGSGSLLQGPFSHSIVGSRDISDGLSMTAGLSENIALRAGGSEADAIRSPMRYYGAVIVPSVSASTLANQTTPQALEERARQTDLSITDCIEGPRNFIPRSEATLGQWSLGFGGGPWTYSHWYPPNPPTCAAFGYGQDSMVFLQNNRRAASSHSGGLNVGFLDGHVQFYSSQVDRTVWRAIGTQNGNEIVRGGHE